MTISDPFNKKYHALLSEAFKKAWSVKFNEWDDIKGGEFRFIKDVDYDCVALPKDTPFELDTSLKTIFKYMNQNYEIDGDKKVSTVDIENTQLCRHIDWIRKILNENGIEFDEDVEKWERLKREAGIL